MIDYTNDGAADPTGYQRLILANRNILPASYSFAIWPRRSRSPGGAGYILSEYNNASSYLGWGIHTDSSYYLKVFHGNGTSWAYAGTPTSALTINTLFLAVFTWDGSNYQWWRDNGVAWGNGAFTQQIADTTAKLTIGAPDGPTNQAFPGALGPILIWPGRVLAQADVQTLYAGDDIPWTEDARLFYRGIAIPGIEEYEDETPSQNGNLWLKSLDPPDSYYPDGLSMEEPPEAKHLAYVAQELNRDRNPRRGHPVSVPLEWLGREAIDDVQLISSAGLEPTGLGFGMSAKSPPRLQRIMEMELAPMSKSINLLLRDIPAVMFYDQLVLPSKVSAGRIGAFELYPPGATKLVTRDSYVWPDQIAGRVTRLTPNVEPVTREGELVESERKNEFENSSFKAGVSTDWTALNTGVNGSAVEDDTDDLLFEPGISAKSCRITAGAPLGANPVGIQQQITLASGDDVLRKPSIDHKDDSGFALSIKIQRSTDSYYRTSLSSDTWGATETYLDLPMSRDRTRYIAMAPIDPGSHSGITYTVGLYAKTAAGQINHVYHCQFEKGGYATSRIVTPGGSTYTRKTSAVRITNYVGARTVHKNRGTLYWRAVPLWAPSERETDAVFLYLYHDSSYYLRIFWEQSSGKLRAHWYDGSNHYSDISSGVSWSAYAELKFGLHWMSDGDLGESGPTFRLHADLGAGWLTGSKGTLSAWGDEEDTSYLQLGAQGDSPTVGVDAYLKYLKSLAEPLLLDNMKALP